jgi:Bacterial Ig-like domain
MSEWAEISGSRLSSLKATSILRKFWLPVSAIVLVIGACHMPQADPASSSAAAFTIVSTTPQNGASNVDPGIIITVVFSQAVDMTPLLDAQQTLVQVTPQPVSADFSLGSDSRTLSVTVHPYLTNGTQYTVEAQGLESASGSELSSPTTWSFSTASNLPAADVQITNANVFEGKKYTNADSVALAIQCNMSHGTISLASTQSGLSAPVQAIALDGNSSATTTWLLDTTSEGPQSVWVQYRDSKTGASSTPRCATVIRTVRRPVLNPFSPSLEYFNSSGTPVTPPTVSASETVASYSWTSSPGVTFAPSASSPSPSITPTGPDGDFTVSLTVADPAGNTSNQQSFTIRKDTASPGTPTAPQIANFQPVTLSMTPFWQYPIPDMDSVENPNYATDRYVVELSSLPSPATVLESGTIPLPLDGKSTSNWSPSAPLPGDGNYALKVWQMDLAGNKSAPYELDFTVTPVIPYKEAVVSGKGVDFQWRDFGGGPPYFVHLGHFDSKGQYQEDTASGSLETAEWYNGKGVMGPIAWYIIQGQGPGSTRNPPIDTYYTFTAQ